MHVRKGEKGSIVLYTNAITRAEHDEKTGEDVEHEIPYMKGYIKYIFDRILNARPHLGWQHSAS